MEKNKLSGKDLEQLKAKGISLDVFKTQLMQFEEGFPAADLTACATADNGILTLTPARVEDLRTAYQAYRKKDGARIVKFVPASGAATRMFKDLYALYNQLKDNATPNAPLDKAAQTFFDHLPQFPFYAELKASLQAGAGLDLDTAVRGRNYLPVLETLLETGMGYGRLPKALLLFHAYADGAVTAMEENFAEGAK